jgi:hypothetical protein
MIIILTISVVIITIFSFFNSYVDAHVLKNKKKIEHFKEGIEQGSFLLILSGINTACIEWNYLTLFLLFSFNLSVFWAIFDYIINFVRNKVQFADAVFKLPWYHTGDNFFDTLLGKPEQRYLRLSLKISLVIITGILSILFA